MDTRIYPDKQFVIDSQSELAPNLLTTDVTHGEPVHSDDLLAIDMKKRCATAEWIKENSIYRDVDGEMRYVLFIDVPGSKFSDKKYTKYGIKKTESTSVKVARSLGILNDLKWKNVISYVNKNDMNGTSDNTDICTIVKHGQLQNPKRSLDIAHWFFQAIYVKLYFDNQSKNLTIKHIAEVIRESDELRQEIDADEWYAFGEEIYTLHKGKFFQDACIELEKKFFNGEVLIKKIYHQGQLLKVGAIQSDNYRIKSAMRRKCWQAPGNQLADVYVVLSSSGARISYDQDYKVDIGEALAVVRYFEHRAYFNNYDYRWNWRTLRRPGMIKQVPQWFYNIEMDILMNSPAHCAPLTGLSLEKLFHCVIVGLNEEVFHPKHEKLCQKGICKIGSSCINIKIGLPRCIVIRSNKLKRIQRAKKGNE